MMKFDENKAWVIKPPTQCDRPCLFLAGTITGGWDWQTYVTNKLIDEKIVILNPRRDSFDTSDIKMEEEQIMWEFRHLRMADAIFFWFSLETVAPITLFELGRHSYTHGHQLFVGTDPNYSRRRDVEIQMGLINPFLPISGSLDAMTAMVKLWLNTDPLKTNLYLEY